MSIISRKSQRVVVIAFSYILKFLFPFKGVTLHHICLIAGPGLSLFLKKKVCCQLEKFPSYILHIAYLNNHLGSNDVEFLIW